MTVKGSGSIWLRPVQLDEAFLWRCEGGPKSMEWDSSHE